MSVKKITYREKEIVARLIKGWSNKAIARDLNIQPHTVTVHLQNIYPKLGVTNRYEVIARYQNPADYETL